ncbi:MAG: (2Fe-2S)-binding protein, partial [Rhodospirillales bacterium]|nr:(2Fe-2S)-binding protein [Rhodospirillales bacterium]
FKAKVKAKAYKAVERSGLVWAFMGDEANMPGLPDIEVTTLPEDDIEITFVLRESNWLQGAEGEFDTSHIGFLHFGTVGGSELEAGDANRFAVANRAPEYKAEETDYGYAYAAYRAADEGETYWRFGQFLYPFWTMPPISSIDKNILTRAYVPIDDENCMIVVVEKKGVIADQEKTGGARPPGHPGAALPSAFLPNTTDWMGRWRLRENRANDYLIDRDMQRSENYTGMLGFVLQDQMITESMEPIVDRTNEHLAPSDIMITRVRRTLVRAAKAYVEGGALPPCAADPALFDGARGGFFVEKDNVTWLDAYQGQIEAAPLRRTKAAQ